MDRIHWEWRITRLLCAAGCVLFGGGAIVLALLTPNPRLHDDSYAAGFFGGILMIVALSIPYWYVTLTVLVLLFVAAIVIFAIPFRVTRGEAIAWAVVALLALPVAGIVRVVVMARQAAEPGPTECSLNPKFGQGPNEKQFICHPWIVPSFAPRPLSAKHEHAALKSVIWNRTVSLP